MDLLSILLLILLGIWAVAAVRYLLRHGSCGCGQGTSCCKGGCSSCRKGCHSCK